MYFIFLLFINIGLLVGNTFASDIPNEELKQLLKGTTCEGKMDFAKKISQIHDSSSLDIAVDALYDECLILRLSAIEALGAVADKTKVDSLHKLLIKEANNNFIIEEIFSALGNINSESTVDVMIELIEEKSLNNYWIGNALELLATFDNMKSVSFLTRFYIDSKNYLSDRYLALELLSQMNSENAKDSIDMALKSEDPIVKKMTQAVVNATGRQTGSGQAK